MTSALHVSTDLYDKLTHVFHRVFGRNDICVTPELKAKDVPGWNSFKLIEIILAVEECFGIQLGSRDVDELESVGDLASVIASKLREA
jgi:acyl carrier protein